MAPEMRMGLGMSMDLERITREETPELDPEALRAALNLISIASYSGREDIPVSSEYPLFIRERGERITYSLSDNYLSSILTKHGLQYRFIQDIYGERNDPSATVLFNKVLDTKEIRRIIEEGHIGDSLRVELEKGKFGVNNFILNERGERLARFNANSVSVCVSDCLSLKEGEDQNDGERRYQHALDVSVRLVDEIHQGVLTRENKRYELWQYQFLLDQLEYRNINSLEHILRGGISFSLNNFDPQLEIKNPIKSGMIKANQLFRETKRGSKRNRKEFVVRGEYMQPQLDFVWIGTRENNPIVYTRFSNQLAIDEIKRRIESYRMYDIVSNRDNKVIQTMNHGPGSSTIANLIMEGELRIVEREASQNRILFGTKYQETRLSLSERKERKIPLKKAKPYHSNNIVSPFWDVLKEQKIILELGHSSATIIPASLDSEESNLAVLVNSAIWNQLLFRANYYPAKYGRCSGRLSEYERRKILEIDGLVKQCREEDRRNRVERSRDDILDLINNLVKREGIDAIL